MQIFYSTEILDRLSPHRQIRYRWSSKSGLASIVREPASDLVLALSVTVGIHLALLAAIPCRLCPVGLACVSVSVHLGRRDRSRYEFCRRLWQLCRVCRQGSGVEVGMLESVEGRDAFQRVEGEELAEEVDCAGWSTGEEGSEVLLRLEFEVDMVVELSEILR